MDIERVLYLPPHVFCRLTERVPQHSRNAHAPTKCRVVALVAQALIERS